MLIYNLNIFNVIGCNRVITRSNISGKGTSFIKLSVVLSLSFVLIVHNYVSSAYILGGFLWSLQDKHQYLEIRGNGTEVYYSGRDHQIVEEEEMGPMVRADRPIPRQGMFFFEVSIVNVGRNKEVAVGICTRTTPLHSFPGWDPCSFGYHGDDGNIFCETDADPKYTPEKPFKSGDPIGVALDFNSATLTFYRKQKEIQRIQLPRHQMDQDYYPCIGISSPGAIVRLTMPIGGKASV